MIFSQQWVTELNKEYSPAVVIIVNMKDGELENYGSGFNVRQDGLIVTNYHVVKEADKIKVIFKNGDEFEAIHYLFVDENKDFVIIKIPGFELPTVQLANSETVEIGNEVIAIGNPKGAWHTVTDGIISQKVDFNGYVMFQTNVFIAPGSSGGPLFNNKKETIGVTSSGIGEGMDINFAIPINYVRGAINSLDYNSSKIIGFDIKKVTYRPPSNISSQSSTNVPNKYQPRKYYNKDRETLKSMSKRKKVLFGCGSVCSAYTIILANDKNYRPAAILPGILAIIFYASAIITE